MAEAPRPRAKDTLRPTADPIPKPPPKLGASKATREERECFGLFEQHDSRRKTKDIPGWSPIAPIEKRDRPEELSSESENGNRPKQNAFERIMSSNKRPKKRSARAVGLVA